MPTESPTQTTMLAAMTTRGYLAQKVPQRVKPRWIAVSRRTPFNQGLRVCHLCNIYILQQK